jgi:hypothetical protein
MRPMKVASRVIPSKAIIHHVTANQLNPQTRPAAIANALTLSFISIPLRTMALLSSLLLYRDFPAYDR